VVVLLADVAADAVLVPLLHRRPIVFVRTDDLHVVEPLAALDVPAGRQHDDPALVDGRQVVLNPAAAERVFDPVFPRRSGDVRLGDEVRAVGHPELERLASKRDAGLGEVALDARGVRRLDHLAVPAALPLVVDVAVARGAHRRSDWRCPPRRLAIVGPALCRRVHGPRERETQREDQGPKTISRHRGSIVMQDFEQVPNPNSWTWRS
jgi:hypothetical protein